MEDFLNDQELDVLVELLPEDSECWLEAALAISVREERANDNGGEDTAVAEVGGDDDGEQDEFAAAEV